MSHLYPNPKISLMFLRLNVLEEWFLPSRNLALLEELGEKGCKTCIILSAPASQHEDLRACALRHNMRLLGPNSLGLLAPWQGLNASFSPVPIKRGKLAFISQSAAVSNTILD